MAGEQYGSVGAAFSTGLDDYLMRQQAMAHQALLDQITQRREQRLETQDGLEMELKREELKARRETSAENIRSKKFDTAHKIVADAGPGDVFTPEQTKLFQEVGLSPQMNPAPTETIPAGQPQVTLPGGGPQVPLPASPALAVPVGPQTYAGNRQQRAAQDLLKTMPPDSPERKQLEFFLATGKELPAGMFPKVAGPAEMEPVYRQNPRNGTIEKVGEVPKGTHFMTEPAPPASQTNIRVPVFRITADGKMEEMGEMPKGGRIATVPGATAAAQKNVSIETGRAATKRLTSDIEQADAMGLIGPASGRIYQAFAKAGSTGDPKKDEMIGRLKADILLAKMHVDAGIGGTRAASSPLLLKNWEDIAMSGSKDLLLGYVQSIDADMGSSTSSAAGASGNSKRSLDDLWKEAGSGR